MSPCKGIKGRGSEDYEACVRSVARMELRGRLGADTQFKNVLRAYPTVTAEVLRTDLQDMKARWYPDDAYRLQKMKEDKAKGKKTYYSFELHLLPIDTAIVVQTAILARYKVIG